MGSPTAVLLRDDDPAADWTLPGVYKVGSGLYRIPLPLPEDGLRAVNVYAVRDDDGLVMVDSGWALAEARDLLEQAIKVLGGGLADIRRFLVTHVHRDHYTMAVAIRREFGTRIALGRGEAGTLRVVQRPADHGAMLAPLRRGGAHQLAQEFARLPDDHRPEDWADPDEWIDAPTDISLAATTLRAYPTPGHTRGHVVFVDAARDVMFAGDHVLPRITPSIGFEANAAELPLRDYLDSLALVRTLPDRRLLPAHGPVAPSVHARVDELIDHHDTRLARIQDLIGKQAGTAAEVARRMVWTRRDRTFGELDLLSQCLAVTETLAHLDVLVATGRLRETDVNGIAYFAGA
jgi:glyoxylase-like metal-dependent hydrolase (beta-lactamase superfamily II)